MYNSDKFKLFQKAVVTNISSLQASIQFCVMKKTKWLHFLRNGNITAMEGYFFFPQDFSDDIVT